MSVNLAAGSAHNVQQSLATVRQNISADQVAAAAVVEAGNQASKISVQAASEPKESAPVSETRGSNVDVQI